MAVRRGGRSNTPQGAIKMSNDEKATVNIDADGAVVKCGKGLDGSECGYVKGAEICGKCGAMAVQVKMVPVDIFDTKVNKPELDDEDAEMTEDPADDDIDTGEDEGDENEEDSEEKAVPMEDEEDEEDEEESMDDEEIDADMDEDDDEDEDMDVDAEEEDEEDLAKEMEPMRKRRIESMGMKSDDFGNGGYVCAIERKAYGGGVSVCDDCPGGCVSEKGLPGLLHVEGLAEEMFDGEVIDSGYSSTANMFVVDVQVKDGNAVEVFLDGTTAEVVGWHKLDEEIFQIKSLDNELTLIDFSEAAEIAVKSIDGHVVAVEPDSFEGYDAYAVEIDGFDGKSYDVFVAMDGEILGYDKYEPEEAEEIEAEAAEIALKRAFTEEQRTSMSKEGTALPDGSFPIASSDDLRNAIQSVGRAKDQTAAKMHCMKRAKEMNMEKLIPATWLVNGDVQSKEKSAESVEGEFLKSLVEFQLLELEEDTI